MDPRNKAAAKKPSFAAILFEKLKRKLFSKKKSSAVLVKPYVPEPPSRWRVVDTTNRTRAGATAALDTADPDAVVRPSSPNSRDVAEQPWTPRGVSPQLFQELIDSKSTTQYKVQTLVAEAATQAWSITANHHRLRQYVRWLLSSQVMPLLCVHEGPGNHSVEVSASSVDEDMLRFEFLCLWKALMHDVSAQLETNAQAEQIIGALHSMELFQRYGDKATAVRFGGEVLQRQQENLYRLAVMLQVLHDQREGDEVPTTFGETPIDTTQVCHPRHVAMSLTHKRSSSHISSTNASSSSARETMSDAPSSATHLDDDDGGSHQQLYTERFVEPMSPETRHTTTDIARQACSTPTVFDPADPAYLYTVAQSIAHSLSAVEEALDRTSADRVPRLEINWFVAQSRAETARLYHDRRRQKQRSIPKTAARARSEGASSFANNSL